MHNEHELHRALGRLEGKLDSVMTYLKQGKADADELEGRVAKVERRQSWLSGVSAAVGLLAGFFIPNIELPFFHG